MGAQLVGLVLANHSSLSDRAFRLAVRMAHSALDTPNGKGQPAGVYFGGWELLALTLGRKPEELDKNHSPKTWARAKETVRRATQELVRAGIVEPLGPAYSGRRQAYRLHLTGSAASAAAVDNAPVDETQRGTATGPLWATATGALLPGMGHRHGGERGTATGAPRKDEEPGTDEDVSQEPPLTFAASTPERARGAVDDDEVQPVRVTGAGAPRGADACRAAMRAAVGQ